MGTRPAAAFLAGGLLAFSTAAGQTVEEKVEVDFVRIVVAVRDGKGRPVTDIRPSEVHLQVDGKTRPIAAFEPLAGDAETPDGKLLRRELPPSTSPPAAVAGSPPPFRLESALAILVDETTSQQFHRNAVYAEVLRFLDGGLPPGTLIALARFDGELRWECPWTADVGKLRQTATAMREHAFAARIGAPGKLASVGGAGLGGPGSGTQEAESLLESSAAALVAALREFPEEPADRKALVYVTDGGPFLTQTEVATELIASARSSAENLPPQFRASVIEREVTNDNSLVVEAATTRRRWFSQMTDAADLAIRRGIEILPVRSGTLDADALASADGASTLYDPEKALTTTGALVPRRATSIDAARIWAGVGMEQMADETGGEAVLSRGDLARRLRRELNDRDAGYALAFRDPAGADNLFHAVSVEIDRPGLRLRYRRGYRIVAPGARLIEGLVGRLYQANLENPLQASMAARVADRKPRAVEIVVTVAYPAPDVGGTAPRRRIEIVGVCATGTGRRSEPFRLVATVPVSDEPDGSARVEVPFRVRLTPGRTRIHLAVRDAAADSTSFLRLERDF